MRIGFGKDLHILKKGDFLNLGGVKIPSPLTAESVSDGDVLIHALCDAILGALGKGDIGEMFPPNDPKNKGRNSTEFLVEVKKLLDDSEYEISNIDTLILLETPSLKNFKEKIKENLSKILDISKKQINIKAGTNEGVDAIGHKEAIKATVVVLLEEKRNV